MSVFIDKQGYRGLLVTDPTVIYFNMITMMSTLRSYTIRRDYRLQQTKTNTALERSRAASRPITHPRTTSLIKMHLSVGLFPNPLGSLRHSPNPLV